LSIDTPAYSYRNVITSPRVTSPEPETHSGILTNGVSESATQARAIVSYKARKHGEMSFVKDDLIHLLESSSDGRFYRGSCGLRTGWFPAETVELLQPLDSQPAVLRMCLPHKAISHIFSQQMAKK